MGIGSRKEGRRLDSLARLARAVTASLELPAVLDSVARAAIELLPHSSVRIWVVEAGRRLLRSAAGTNGTPAFGVKTELALGQGLTGHVAITKAPLVVEDVLADSRTVNVEWMIREGYVSYVGVPFLVRERIVGVLSLFTRHFHRFTHDELEILISFGSQAAIAIENARLYEEVREARDFLRSIAENSVDGIVTTDVRGRITYWSPGAEEMFGHAATEVFGRRVSDFYRGGPAEARVIMRDLMAHGRIGNYETALRARDGRWVDINTSISLLKNADGDLVGTLGIVKDITERKRVETALRRSEERLKELSFKDEITGLHNRRFFSVRLEEEIARFRRFNHPLSVVLLDMDGFKEVNDEFGHATGDETLRQIGHLLLTHSRGVNAIARYGGDEFAVLLVETPRTGAWSYADRVRGVIGSHRFAHGLGITASFGVASVPEDVSVDSSDELMRAADDALYTAKRTGRNAVAGYPASRV